MCNLHHLNNCKSRLCANALNHHSTISHRWVANLVSNNCVDVPRARYLCPPPPPVCWTAPTSLTLSPLLLIHKLGAFVKGGLSGRMEDVFLIAGILCLQLEPMNKIHRSVYVRLVLNGMMRVSTAHVLSTHSWSEQASKYPATVCQTSNSTHHQEVVCQCAHRLSILQIEQD